MRKLARFFAISLLVLSISAVALGDGGQTQGPNVAQPPVPPVDGTTATQSPSEYSFEQTTSVDFETGLTIFISVLTNPIL